MHGLSSQRGMPSHNSQGIGSSIRPTLDLSTPAGSGNPPRGCASPREERESTTDYTDNTDKEKDKQPQAGLLAEVGRCISSCIIRVIRVIRGCFPACLSSRVN